MNQASNEDDLNVNLVDDVGGRVGPARERFGQIRALRGNRTGNLWTSTQVREGVKKIFFGRFTEFFF